ncbi:MAG: hypothetical protein MI740_17945 [Halanaerobiales bacterium]|nr:hypothetical protein [Halanaerobiales bacterium]
MFSQIVHEYVIRPQKALKRQRFSGIFLSKQILFWPVALEFLLWYNGGVE